MTMTPDQYPAEVGQLVHDAGAALRVWMCAVQAEREAILPTEAAMLQVALGVVIDALREACDDETVEGTAMALPLYRARDLLGLVDGVLWAFQGGDAAPPSRADLLCTAKLAGATMAKFGVGPHVSAERPSNVVPLRLVRIDAPRPTH